MVYLVVYDLNNPNTPRKEVEQAIKQVSTSWCSFWKSAYLIRSGLPSSQIIAKIQPILDDVDRLFIVESTRDYQGWLTDDQWAFVEKNIYR